MLICTVYFLSKKHYYSASPRYTDSRNRYIRKCCGAHKCIGGGGRGGGTSRAHKGMDDKSRCFIQNNSFCGFWNTRLFDSRVYRTNIGAYYHNYYKCKTVHWSLLHFYAFIITVAIALLCTRWKLARIGMQIYNVIV